MSVEWSVFRYDDETRARIAPISLIRFEDDHSPYRPAASTDIPSRKVEVKWQRSLTQGSFSGDGYYPGTILLNACAVKSAQLKCSEADIKLHPSPVIGLPARTMPLTLTTCETKLRTRNKTADEPRPSVKPQQPSKPSSQSHKSSSGSKSEKKESKSSSRKKVNVAAKDDVRKSRLLEVINKVETNPLFASEKSHKVDLTAAEHNTSENSAEEVASEKLVTADHNTSGKDSHLSLDELVTAEHMENASGNNKSKCDSRKHNASGSSKSKSDSGTDSESGNSNKSDTDSESIDSNENISDSSVEKQSTVPAYSSGSDSEDPLSKALDENLELKATVKALKTELEDAKRMLNVSNKMRAELQKKSKSLEESAKNTQDEIDLLRRRNGALQDALTDRALAGPSPKERHRNRAHHQTEKEKDKRSHPHSSDHGGISKKLKSSHQSSHSTPIKSTPPACSPDSPFSIQLNSPLGSPIESPLKIKSPKASKQVPPKKSPKSSKKCKPGAIDFLHDTDINDVCDRVQKHLQKTEVITPDSKGRINVGCNVKWDVKSFEDIVENNKVNVTKMAQNLAMQTWSKKERVDRSLDGKKSNRFPNAPVKQAATPSKVKAIIGAVKAVMKSSGDQEGPSMAFTLKSCRSAIGHKFSNEAFKSQLDFS